MAPAGWVRTSGLAVTDDGFLRVNEFLQSVSHPEVFGAGDVATMDRHARPKSGVFAVRQGPPLAENLRRAVTGLPLVPYRPQRAFLSLIGLGRREAVASRNGLAARGRWVWRWKEWIDRRWMRRYQRLIRRRSHG